MATSDHAKRHPHTSELTVEQRAEIAEALATVGRTPESAAVRVEVEGFLPVLVIADDVDPRSVDPAEFGVERGDVIRLTDLRQSVLDGEIRHLDFTPEGPAC